MKKKAFIFILIIIILPIVICSILLLINNPNRFSEEEHLARVAERIEKRRQNETWFDGKKYESFEVYPLYDINEELKYFLICAVKRGNDFINLLDGKVIEISNGEITKKQPDLSLAFYASKNFVL